ncbi:unnamed protein product [Linum trigynum]|uniref:Uncharacterized protein n=1 Tax=Linum trigynum TaxID=586398 RepID=A0AAV2EBY5_9ROSI
MFLSRADTFLSSGGGRLEQAARMRRRKRSGRVEQSRDQCQSTVTNRQSPIARQEEKRNGGAAVVGCLFDFAGRGSQLANCERRRGGAAGGVEKKKKKR